MDSRGNLNCSIPQRGTGMLYSCLQNYNQCLKLAKCSEKDFPESFDIKASMFSYKNDQKNVLITKQPTPSSGNIGQDKDNWFSAKSNKAIPISCGVFYYEVKIVSFGQSGGQFVIGIGSQRSSIARNAPGLDNESYGFQPRTGILHLCGVQHALVAPSAPQDGAIYGCGVNFLEDEIFFTCNGQLLGKKRQLNLIRENKSQRNIRDTSQWHPMIALKNVDAELMSNFGSTFTFRLRQYLQQQQLSEQARAHDLFSQHASNEGEIRELAFQFLLQHGYTDTANALSKCSSLAVTHDMGEEKRVMSSRQRIGQHLHNNEFNIALAILDRDWPQFSSLYPLLYFKLLVLDFRSKVRTYLELIDTSPTVTGVATPVSTSPLSVEDGSPQSALQHLTSTSHSNSESHASPFTFEPALASSNGSDVPRIRQYIRMLQQNHYQRHPGTDSSASFHNMEFHDASGGAAYHHNGHSLNGNHQAPSRCEDHVMEVDSTPQSTTNSSCHNGTALISPLSTEDKIRQHSDDIFIAFTQLLEIGSQLKLKSIELVEKRYMEAEYYNLLEQLFRAIASGEMLPLLRSPTLPEGHLLRSVDMALLHCQRGSTSCQVAPKITNELLMLDKNVVSGRMNTKQTMMVHLQQSLSRNSTNNSLESGFIW